MGKHMLHPSRHDRGWPRIVLLQWTGRSARSFRLYVEAQGTVDAHDARGKSWEVIQWCRRWPTVKKAAGTANAA
jgi:hypothetical protein